MRAERANPLGHAALVTTPNLHCKTMCAGNAWSVTKFKVACSYQMVQMKDLDPAVSNVMTFGIEQADCVHSAPNPYAKQVSFSSNALLPRMPCVLSARRALQGPV